MAKTITAKFKLASLLSVLLSILMSKVFSIIGSILSSDIMITGSSKLWIRILPSILNYLGIFFNVSALAAAVASVFYALYYFGKRTAVRSGIISVICSALSVITSVIYSAIVNDMEAARLIAAVLVLLIDVAYFAAALVIAGFICSLLLAKSKKHEKQLSPIVPAAITWDIVLLIHVVDLTLSSVLPFVMNNIVISSDIHTIIGDYIYYVIVYGILPFSLTLLFMPIYRRVTGALMQKNMISFEK